MVSRGCLPGHAGRQSRFLGPDRWVMNFFTVRGDKLQPQTVFGGTIGGNFFQALGVRAAAGRLVGPEDVHMGYQAPVAVVSCHSEVSIRSRSGNHRQENRRQR